MVDGLKTKLLTAFVAFGILLGAACTPQQVAAMHSGHRHEVNQVSGHTWGKYEQEARIYTNFWAAVIRANQVPNEANWDRVAACESGGNWSINTGNGYYGGLQFNLGTWRAYGGVGYPHQNSKANQVRVAERVRTQSGLHHWPHCGRRY